MTMKLVQKYFFKGTREFEITNDVIHVRIKTLFKQEKITLGLSVLDPEPVINKPLLEFYSRAEPGPVLSLFLDKPNVAEFSDFVVALQKRVLEASGAGSGFDANFQPAGITGNAYGEAPEFEEFNKNRFKIIGKSINSEKLDNAIQMLEKYVDDEAVKPLLSALKSLKEDPQNESYMAQVVNEFNDLGIAQGAVLTYAPYISVLLMDDPYGNH